jgi:hypothetical protein
MLFFCGSTAGSRKSPYRWYMGVSTYRIVFVRSRYVPKRKLFHGGSGLLYHQQRRVDPRIFYGAESLFDYSSCCLKRA